MSETTQDGFNWDEIVHDTPASNSGSRAAATAPEGKAAPMASNNLPPFPQGFAYMVGRLPLSECTPGKAIVQLPEAVDGVHCAFVVANTGVLSDCYSDNANEASPQVRNARPINDREIAVFFTKGEGVAKGPGWVAGQYPGSMPTTRSVGLGVPYVEVLVIVGPDCGCSSEDWYSDPYQQ